MLLEIQSILKEQIITHTGLSTDQVFSSPPPPNTAKPYVSIIPLKGLFTPAWHWEQNTHVKCKVQRKYNVQQPLTLVFCYTDKNILSDDLNRLLIHLPKECINRQISLLPVEITYIFAEGALGSHQATLLIHADYGIYQHIHHSLIKNISINVLK